MTQDDCELHEYSGAYIHSLLSTRRHPWGEPPRNVVVDKLPGGTCYALRFSHPNFEALTILRAADFDGQTARVSEAWMRDPILKWLKGLEEGVANERAVQLRRQSEAAEFYQRELAL